MKTWVGEAVRGFLIVSASFLWAVTAQAQSDKSDFDLVCAVTTAAQMNQDEQKAAATLPAHTFYIGRLSARDDRTNWTIVIASRAPLACAVAVIRWGSDASSDKLRAGARCTSCGGKGATLQRPGWAGNHVGFYPFPTSIADEMRIEHTRRVLGE
jgi:hypothetical protein